MFELPSPVQSKIKKLDLSQISFKNAASPRLPFPAKKLKSPKHSNALTTPKGKSPKFITKFPESVFQNNPSIILPISPIVSPKNSSNINPLSRISKNSLLFDNTPRLRNFFSPKGPVYKTEGLIESHLISTKRKIPQNDDFSEHIPSGPLRGELSKNKQSFSSSNQKRPESIGSARKPGNPSEINNNNNEDAEGECVAILGKVLQEEAMKLYSAKSARNLKRHEKKKSDIPALYTSRVKTERNESSPGVKALQRKVTFDHITHIRTESLGGGTGMKKDMGLSNQTHYNLLDKQKATEHEINRRRPVKKSGDLQMLKCFQELKTNIKRDLLNEPRISFYQNFTIKKISSLRLENVEMIKDICRGNVFSKRNTHKTE